MGLIVSLVVALCLIILDQTVKHWVTSTIAFGVSKTVIPHILALTNLHNNGAAWSILEGAQWFFIVITILALLVVGYLMVRWRHRPLLLGGLSLILAGTIGNFIDRLMNGYVVDMFELRFINFPIFNVADVCLTCGAIILVIAILREED